MKKAQALAIILYFTCAFCQAEKKTSLSLSPHIGFTFGQLDEILYAPDGSIRSLLEWEEKPLINIGLSADLELNNFSIISSFEYGTKIANPQMYDSDWSDGIKYSYTTHPLESSKEINAGLQLAYKLLSKTFISLSPAIELQYMYDSFNSGTGSGTRNDRQIRVNKVDYSRHTLFTFTGIKINSDINKYISLKAAFFISPYTFQYARDYHHGTKEPYPFTALELQDCFFSKYKFAATFSWHFTKLFTLDFYSNVIFGGTDKGTYFSDYYRDEIVRITDQQTGSKLFSTKFGIATTFKFF